MKKHPSAPLLAGLFAAIFLFTSCWQTPGGKQSASNCADPLPSWNNGAVKTAIVDFVAAVTTEGGASFVPPEDRIATFDNDGTLWAEHPVVQIMFVFHRVKQMAGKNPALKDMQPYKAVLENDKAYLETMGQNDFLKLFVATQIGMGLSEYRKEVAAFFAHAKSPSGKTIRQLRYQPQL